MIEINLLPEELRKQPKKNEFPQISISKLPLRRIAIIAIVAFVVLQLLAATALFFKKNSLKKLNRRIAELETTYKIAKSYKIDMQGLNDKVSAINELTSKSILWSKKMSDLSAAITDGVWLKELSLHDEKGPKNEQAMLLKGSVFSYTEGEEAAMIGSFINSLKSNKGFFEDFSDIRLESSRMRSIAELEVMDFTIICYFKGGRSYFDKHKR